MAAGPGQPAGRKARCDAALAVTRRHLEFGGTRCPAVAQTCGSMLPVAALLQCPSPRRPTHRRQHHRGSVHRDQIHVGILQPHRKKLIANRQPMAPTAPPANRTLSRSSWIAPTALVKQSDFSALTSPKISSMCIGRNPGWRSVARMRKLIGTSSLLVKAKSVTRTGPGGGKAAGATCRAISRCPVRGMVPGAASSTLTDCPGSAANSGQHNCWTTLAPREPTEPPGKRRSVAPSPN